MPENKKKAEEFRIALEECWNALNEAYWVSSTMEAKDAITGCLDHISDLIDIMQLASFTQRTAQFQAVADQIEIGNKKLTKLKEDIDDLIKKVSTITKVLATIEKVFSYIPLLPL